LINIADHFLGDDAFSISANLRLVQIVSSSVITSIKDGKASKASAFSSSTKSYVTRTFSFPVALMRRLISIWLCSLYDDCVQQYSAVVWEMLSDAFKCLPIAAELTSLGDTIAHSVSHCALKIL
jgi:hypothetical protein